MNQQAAGSRIAGQPSGGEQPAGPGESQPGGGSQPQESLHESLRRKLFKERKAQEGNQESVEEQPGGNEAEPTGQAPEGQGDDPRGASDLGDDPNNDPESDPEGEGNPEGEEPGDPEGEKDPEGDGEPEALTVDDRQYTPEDVRALEKRNRELDADYRRKTSVMSRMRQEYAAHGEELTEVSNFFTKLASSNLQQLEAVDPESLSQEEFGHWKQQLNNAKMGRDQLLGAVDALKKKVSERRNKMLDHQAAESADILKGIDPRWSNEFYGKIRDFAVESGRYDAKEFADVTDWRAMEGLIALYDRAEAEKRVSQRNRRQPSEIEEPQGRRRRRRGARQPRNDQGKFQSAEKAVQESTNAKADGSLRNLFQQRLAKERSRR